MPTTASLSPVCPQCSSSLGMREAIEVARLGRGLSVTACAFCGSFVARVPELNDPYPVIACESCGAPSMADGGAQSCRTCRAAEASPERGADGAPEGRNERILKEALGLYPEVHGPETTTYFARIVTGLGGSATRTGSGITVHPVFDLGFRAIALPGAEILVGITLLRELQDEAGLAFVVARQMEHLQSGRVERRFRARKSGTISASLEWGFDRLTMGAFSLSRPEADTIVEVAVLGYGPAHELDADDRALRRITAAGYDPSAAVRYLAQVERRQIEARGALAAFLDPRPARSRRRCLIETLAAAGGLAGTDLKVNREVYRRAIGKLHSDDVPVGAGDGGGPRTTRAGS